jgi:hypothetical protein
MNSQPEKAVGLRRRNLVILLVALLEKVIVGAGRRLFLAANSFACFSR